MMALSSERNFIAGLACLVYILLTTVFFITLQTSTTYKEALYHPSHADCLVGTALNELEVAIIERNGIFVSESLRALRVQARDKAFGESLMRSEHIGRLLNLLKYKNRWPTSIRISALSVILEAVRDNRKAAKQAIKNSLVDDLIACLSNEAYLLETDQRPGQFSEFHRNLMLGIFAVMPSELIVNILIALSCECPDEMTNVIVTNIGYFVDSIKVIIRATSSEASFIHNHPRIRLRMGRLVDQSLLLLEMLPSTTSVHKKVLYDALKRISLQAGHYKLPFSQRND